MEHKNLHVGVPVNSVEDMTALRYATDMFRLLVTNLKNRLMSAIHAKTENCASRTNIFIPHSMQMQL